MLSAQQVVAPGEYGGPAVVLQSAVAADPAHPNRAVVATQSQPVSAEGARQPGAEVRYAWTTDGGATWHPALVSGLVKTGPWPTGGRWDSAASPSLAFAADGSAYLAARLSRGECESAIVVVRSTDGGRTFGEARLAQHSRSCSSLVGFIDLAVDAGARSPHVGRLYVGWTSFEFRDGELVAQHQVVRASANRGRTWGAPVTLTQPGAWSQATQLAVQPEGQLTAAYWTFSPDTGHAYLTARTSANGGRSFGQSVRISRNPVDWPLGTVDVRCCFPSLTADPVTGRLHLAVSDSRRAPRQRIDALVFSSADGRSWTGPVNASRSDREAERSALTPAVSAYGDTVYVSWTSLRHGPSGNIRQRVAVSVDGGRFFGPATDMGPVGDVHYGLPPTCCGYFFADRIESATVRGQSYVAWVLPTRPSGPNSFKTRLWAATVSTTGQLAAGLP